MGLVYVSRIGLPADAVYSFFIGHAGKMRPILLFGTPIIYPQPRCGVGLGDFFISSVREAVNQHGHEIIVV